MPRKTVLVTGASRGIGKAVAVKFAKKGYNVAISCVHREEQLMQTRKEIESFHGPLPGIQRRYGGHGLL